MTPVAQWFAKECAGAPQALRAEAERYLGGVAAGQEVSETLASAAQAALADTLAHRGDRPIARTLLAADALVTLALLAKAQHDPGALAGFAGGLRKAGAAIR